MKTTENFGCRTHHKVFFSRQEMEKHIRGGCHIENIFILKDEDFLGRMSYNILSEAIDALNLPEEEKEGYRQLYFKQGHY